jgi:hypothetical protein|tara:strand:- start:459 stop:662 length:204 start_codon:yes stop_codon:yes gene_type:complete
MHQHYEVLLGRCGAGCEQCCAANYEEFHFSLSLHSLHSLGWFLVLFPCGVQHGCARFFWFRSASLLD